MNQDEENSQLKRYSFTLPESLVESVDEISKGMKMNRSMVVRESLNHWVNHQLTSKQMDGHGVAVFSYIYQHHEHRIVSELMDVQHDYGGETIITSSHVHLTHADCFETVICRGDLRSIKQLANQMRSIKGISSFNVEYAQSHLK